MNLSRSHAQTESAVFTINSVSIISTNNAMIDPLDSDPEINSLSYTPKNPVQFLVGNSAVTVKTCVFDNWDKDEEKYGFNVISVYRNANKVFDLKQSENWAYTYAGACTYDYRKYTNNKYYVPVKLSNQSTALFFVGWPLWW